MAITYEALLTEGLAKQISEKIRDAILDGRLAVDARLPTEEELAARFNVSRPTVREALKRLAAQNLIRSRRGPTGGTFVTRPTREEARAGVATAAALLVSMGEFRLDDIVEARALFEQAACELAVERRTDADMAALSAALAPLQDATLSDAEFCAADVRYHRALIAAAHNPALDYASASLVDSLQPVLNLLVFRTRERREVVRDLSRLTAALEERDAVRAATALRAYFDTLARHGRRALEGSRHVAAKESRHG